MKNNLYNFIIILSIFLLLPIKFFAQSPYEMNWKRDGALIVIGLPVAAIGITLDRSLDPLTLEEVNNLDRNKIFNPDKFISYNYSESAANLSDILLYSCLASPLLLLTSKSIRNDFAVISGMYLESLILGVALPAYGKGGVQRVRPYTYNPDVPMEMKLTAEAKKSFFSGHTTMSFTSMVFFSTIYSTYYPDSKAKPYLWAGSILLASSVGYLRIASGKHFLTDVLFGAIVGSAIGYFIPKIHETDPDNLEPAMPNASPRTPLISLQFGL
jgi:membrane-associated phospholipid phosphatase